MTDDELSALLKRKEELEKKIVKHEMELREPQIKIDQVPESKDLKPQITKPRTLEEINAIRTQIEENKRDLEDINTQIKVHNI
jgi:hypothetical protein